MRRAGLVVERLDAETVANAQRFARECQATAFAVFGGLFQALLSRYSGQSDILFLTPHANRTGNTETIMGPLADPICLTGHIAAGTTFRELVTRFGAESMDAMEQALPLNLVTPLIDMRVGRDYHPLNQITFFYQRAFVHDMRWKDMEIDVVARCSHGDWKRMAVGRGGAEGRGASGISIRCDAVFRSDNPDCAAPFRALVARGGDGSG